MKTPEPKNIITSMESRLPKEKQRLVKLYEKLKAQDRYLRLRVAVDATEDDINKAYLEKVSVFNPAKHPEELKEINQRVLALYWETKVLLLNKKTKTAYEEKSKIKNTNPN